MRMVNTGSLLCETHAEGVKQMFDLEPIEESALLDKCATNTNHTQADSYCVQCKHTYCSKCALNHVAHGIQSIPSMIEKWQFTVSSKIQAAKYVVCNEQSIWQTKKQELLHLQRVCTHNGTQHI